MPILLALAVAAAFTPPSPEQAADIRCIALLAIVANEQAHGTGWTSYPPLADDGARYSDVTGTAVMKSTGRTKEQVRALFVAAVAGFQSAAVRGRDHTPDLTREVDRCLARMRVRAPAPPPPALPRCAAVMGLAYDAVKARDGLTKGAKDLATLASVLAYRARTELTAGGKSEAEADAVLADARAKAANVGATSDDELQACADLAAPAPGDGH